MDDGLDAMLRDQARYERLIPNIAYEQGSFLRQRPVETGAEIIEHHDALAAIDERVNHVASDIAGAASDQDSHARGSFIGVPACAVVSFGLQA
jgi:hypothetical protein